MKKLKVLVVILFVILISIIAFFGVYKKENGVWRNLVADYEYGMDVEGARELIYAVDDTEEEKYVYVDEEGNIKGEVWKDGNSVTQEEEENPEETEETDTENVEEVPYAKETRTVKVNSDDKLTKENFEQAKKIIQKRLKEQELDEYNIRIDDVTGKLVIENENDDETVHLVEQLVSKAGKFQIIDYQNGLVLMDNLDIKNATVVYSNQSSYNTYLQIEFNKEGAQKLKDISNKYVEIIDETESEEQSENTDENVEAEEQETEKKLVSIVFDDDTMMTTYFGEEMSSGLLQIAVGQERTNYEDFIEDYNSAKIIADILNSGVLPITYELETDNFVKSEFISDIQNLISVFLAILIIVPAIIFIVKFKKNGALAAVLNMGYIAILSLVLKYTNVEMTGNSFATGFIMIVVNIAFLKMIVKHLETQEIGQAYAEVSKKFYLASIPVMVASIVFTFVKNYAINSVGMLVFWAIILNVLYNVIVTRTVFDRED